MSAVNAPSRVEPFLAELGDPFFQVVNQGSAVELAAAVLAPPRTHGGTILQRHISHLLGALGQGSALAGWAITRDKRIISGRVPTTVTTFNLLTGSPWHQRYLGVRGRRLHLPTT